MSNYDSSVSNAYLDEKINQINRKEFHPSKFKDLYELKRSLIFENINKKNEYLDLYLKFAEIASKKEFFSIEDIKQLGLEYDILIFLSEKNIGKSHDIITRTNEIVNRGGKVVLMRSIEEHIKLGLGNLLMEDHSEIYLGSDQKLYHKDLPDPNTGKGKAHVGYAMALSTCIKWKGGSFDDVEHIFFDEATDEHRLISKANFNKFFISVANSIERRKKDITIEIFGNTDFSVSHPLFEAFDIDPTENLLYLERQMPGAERPTRILYLNSRGLYPRGAKGSKFIGAISDPRAVLDAFNNQVRNNTDRLISIDLTYLTEQKFSIIFEESLNQETQTWQLVVSTYNHVEQEANEFNNFKAVIKKWYYVKVEPFEPSYLYGYRIYTSDKVLYALYRSFCTFIKDESKLWIMVKNSIKSGRCILIRRDTKDMLLKVLEKKSQNPDVVLGG